MKIATNPVGTFKEVRAHEVKIKGWTDFKFMVHHAIDNDGILTDQFIVSEYSTGFGVGLPTFLLESAIDLARIRLNEHGRAYFENMVANLPKINP